MIDVTKLKATFYSQIVTDDGTPAIDFGFAPAGKYAAQELCDYTLRALQHYASLEQKHEE